MSDYFTARNQRYTQVVANLRTLAAELTELGFTVTHEPTMFFPYILIRRDGMHCFLGFDDIPYQWYISVSHKPNSLTGSGRTVYTQYSNDPSDIPSAEFVISHMAPEYSTFERDYKHSLTPF